MRGAPTIQEIYNGCLDEGIRVIDVRHEQAAVHAADGWSRVTGTPGVAAVTAGPGVTDTVTAVANAMRDQVPLVLLGGQGARLYGPMGGQDRGAFQDMDPVEVMGPITKWARSVPEARRIGEYVQTAFRIAMTGVPGPVFLELSEDLATRARKGLRLRQAVSRQREDRAQRLPEGRHRRVGTSCRRGRRITSRSWRFL